MKTLCYLQVIYIQLHSLSPALCPDECFYYVSLFDETVAFFVSGLHDPWILFLSSFKIPEAYFIRDPHTFLLTKDFIKVYLLYLVQKNLTGP